MYALCPNSNTESNDVSEDFEHAVIEVEEGGSPWLFSAELGSLARRGISQFVSLPGDHDISPN
jgi:hypothetical protein